MSKKGGGLGLQNCWAKAISAESEMSADAPQLRAVLGGTGAYVAAAGEVETVRNADGTYSHRFTLHKVK